MTKYKKKREFKTHMMSYGDIRKRQKKRASKTFFQETLTSVRVIFQNENYFTERVFDKTFYSLLQNDIGNKKKRRIKKTFLLKLFFA